MKELFSLGNIFPSDFLKPDELPRCQPVELKLMLDENGAVRLADSAPDNIMWGEKYWYRSSINTTMRRQLKDVVDSILDTFEVSRNDLFIDIASNDGYLLSCVPEKMIRIGIDPANDSFRIECERYADLVIQDYFTADIFKKSKYGDKKAKVITSISMFYDIKNPDKFIHDVNEILDDNGLWVIQLSYTPLMLTEMAWDNVCHEHWYYYSLFNLKQLLNKNGFQILDCELNNTNSGSFRVYAMKHNADISKFGTQTAIDVCNYRINSLLEYEKILKLDKIETWTFFYHKINMLRGKIRDFIKREKENGKIIMGYGASTKGNTILQYCGIDNSMITAIADRNPYKHGLVTIGTNIPIISEEEMRKAQPDYLLILPFHFIKEFTERESEYLKNGGHFIVISPKFEIISQ